MEEDEETTENTAQDPGSITLELGDIVEIVAPNNADLHQETFFITYLDNQKIRITNVSTFHPYVLKLNEDGQMTDESIKSIVLLSRSKEPGYARQHLLLPKTWVDIHFGGEVPTIITGEITNLEEDMIEVTTYPDVEVIYIDFEYKGIPETIPLEQIIIRTKPASLEKIASMVNVREQLEEEGGDFDPAEILDNSSSIEYNEMGEAIIKHPPSVTPEPTYRDNLHSMFVSANQIIYGEELEEITEQIELAPHQKRYGIETQVNDMLDEMLSDIPNIKRSAAVLDNIHLLIERFRELRNGFSKLDSQGNVQDAKMMGLTFKPLVQHIMQLDKHIKWLIPVAAQRRKIYTNLHPETITDIIQMDQAELLGKDGQLQEDYYKNHNRSDIPAYTQYYQQSNSLAIPYEQPLYPDQYLVANQEVAMDLDVIIQNMENFYSTVLQSTKDSESYARRQFVIQRYQLGQSMLQPTVSAKTGKRVYIREPITPNDEITVNSFLVLPPAFMKYSAVSLPGSSIGQKVSLSHNPLLLFRLLQKNLDIQNRTVDSFDKDLDKDNWSDPFESGLVRRSVQEFTLAEPLERSAHRYRKFLQAMVPSTNTVIDLLTRSQDIRNALSLKQVAEVLEPFLIYVQDLNYYHYNHIRFFIKTQMKEYRKYVVERAEEMNSLRTVHYVNSTPDRHTMMRLLLEKRDLFDILVDAYKLPVDTREQHVKVGTTDASLQKRVVSFSASEWISRILVLDQGRLFSDLVNYMMAMLVMPEDMAEEFDKVREKQGQSDDMSHIEKIKATDCVRRVLTKRYFSMKELQKDNGNHDVTYDKEFDTTPYPILAKYKDEQKKYGPHDFLEFLAEALVNKHECPRKLAGEMAKTLIAGKKAVQEGEYAIVEIKPHYPGDESQLTAAEKKDAEMEADVRKQILYYRRVKNQWVHDDSISEDAFIDNNTLFCNMSTLCFKNTKNDVCEPMKDANERMREISKKRMIDEFDERFAETLQTKQDKLKERIQESAYFLKKIQRIREIQRTKENIVAYELGCLAKTEEVLQSPYVALRDKILGQDDFVKRQTDIIRFATLYCRDPMSAELGENMYWLYCLETNMPLLPYFLLDLASAFTKSQVQGTGQGLGQGNNYLQKQAELCRKQGILSDDGDSIVDRYSGYVIRKIDFVEESGYDDAGFKLLMSGLMEKDAGEKFLEAAQSAAAGQGKTTKKDRVFENATAEMVYKIYAIISSHVGLPLDAIEDFVIRTSLELIDKNIKHQDTYEKEAAKLEKDKGKRPPPYMIYRNKTMILIVTAVILVGIQTATPSFKIRKTFPGCVQSFSGFPANGGSVEDMTGLKYLACILNKTKNATIQPWNSIDKIPLLVLQDQLKKVVEVAILGRVDLIELYAKKREFLMQFPEEDIPKEHAISRWTRFLPPIVEFSIVKSLRPLTNDYKEELLNLMRKGSRDQREHIDLFKTKCMMYGHGLVESIRTVVRSKELLLKTASNMFFTENACCNDLNTARSIDYFMKEDDTIGPAIKMIEGWSTILHSVGQINRASMLFDPKLTMIQYPVIPMQHYEQNVYAAFIWYCNLDRDTPIPEDLRPLMPEKLVDYPIKGSLVEKIEHFKKEGKRLTLANLEQLMNIVQGRNIVRIERSGSSADHGISTVTGLRDFLHYVQDQDVPLFERPLIDRLDAVLAKYNPRIMVAEDSEETRHLKNYLTRANEKMLTVIADFFQTHGNLTRAKFANLQDMLSKIHLWTLDTGSAPTKQDETNMYTVLKFMKNSVFSMSRSFPEVLRNNHSMNDKIPKHWNLSKDHQADIARFLRKYYEPLQKFKQDNVLRKLLDDIQVRLIDMVLFLNTLPTFTPIDREVVIDEQKVNRHFYSLFDKRTLYMLYTYVWYSVVYEYIMATEQVDLLQMDIHSKKMGRREQIVENADPFALGQSPSFVSENLGQDEDELLDVQIVTGNKKELKGRVAELLLAFLDIEGSNKKKLDLSYAEIEKSTSRSKQSEKKEITDFFENMDRDERRVEDMKKSMKLGRWNVGLQKGLVSYDKNTYDRERTDALIEDLTSRTDFNALGEEQMERDIDDLDKEAEDQAEEEGDIEAFGLQELTSDYRDGEYYGEDQDQDQGFGQEEY